MIFIIIKSEKLTILRRKTNYIIIQCLKMITLH